MCRIAEQNEIALFDELFCKCIRHGKYQLAAVLRDGNDPRKPLRHCFLRQDTVRLF